MRKFTALLLAFALVFCFAACGGNGNTDTGAETTDAPEAVPSGIEDGVLTVAMECAYAPYNWSQNDDSNGAVPIKGTNEFANGYDVMTAKKICEKYGWELEIVRLDWDSLVPAVQSGTVDAVIAGQSMTPDREEMVDFAGPYLYASIVCIAKKGSAYENAASIKDLEGATCTSQMSTIWYDTCLEQIKDRVQVQEAAESAGAMLMALETGRVDFVCTDKPTAMGAMMAYDDMVMLDFEGSEDNFVVEESDINIGISVMKGNTELKGLINDALAGMTADDFNAGIEAAAEIQPLNDLVG